MEREGEIIVVGGRSAVIDTRLIKSLRGSFFTKTDMRFVIIALFSVLLHVLIMVGFYSVKLPPVKKKSIEEIPERFARLIVEKPIPKKTQKKEDLALKNMGKASEEKKELIKKTEDKNISIEKPIVDEKQRAIAKKAVAEQVARVEQKIRTVGVLGMLTGVGSTAKGTAVVDVLGAINNRKEKNQDLEKALAEMSGLKQTASVDVAQRKLVKSKDIEVSHRENVDELLTSLTAAKAEDLSKKGNIIISKPQSIEGAASSSAKRDIAAINEVVLVHKMSIKLSYERYLKRIPDLAGKITVRFTIDALGNVSRVEIVENTTGNKELEEEIARKVSMWKFEAIPEGEVTVTYPFVFQPSG
jgi:TonB family protein